MVKRLLIPVRMKKGLHSLLGPVEMHFQDRMGHGYTADLERFNPENVIWDGPNGPPLSEEEKAALKQSRARERAIEKLVALGLPRETAESLV
jgi:hypothetical protein